MRKRLWALLLCLVLVPARSAPARAAEPQASDYVTPGEEADVACVLGPSGLPAGYTVRYTGADLEADGQYLLLVVQGEDPAHPETRVLSQHTILYLDRYTGAQLTGGVTFLPRPGADAVILLGGAFADSPKRLGSIRSRQASVTLPQITAGSAAAPPTVTLRDGAGGVITLEMGADGSFRCDEVPLGTYTLTVRKPGYLTYTAAITVGSGGSEIPAVKLLAGDANGDGSINALDLGEVLRDFGKEPLSATDLNEDGFVNAQDLSAVLANFGKTY